MQVRCAVRKSPRFEHDSIDARYHSTRQCLVKKQRKSIVICGLICFADRHDSAVQDNAIRDGPANSHIGSAT